MTNEEAILEKLARIEVRLDGVGRVEKQLQHMEVHLDEVKPVGPLGLMWRLRSQEGREGLGVLPELTPGHGYA